MLDLPKKAVFIPPLVNDAQSLLDSIKSQPHFNLRANSPAYAAFDARISRHLHSLMPMKPLVLLSQDEAWVVAKGLLEGWSLIPRLVSCESLITWNVSQITGVDVYEPTYVNRQCQNFELAFLNGLKRGLRTCVR